MGLASATAEVTYTGNGAVSTYAYTFKIFDQDHLEVIVRNTSDVETVLTLTTDYTVTGVNASGGGNVVLVSSGQAWLTAGKLTSGYILTIRRVVPLTQETDIRNQGTFYPETHEDEFDLLVMADQQQQKQIDRSVKMPRTVLPANFDPEIPAGFFDTYENFLKLNATLDGWDYGTSTTAIEASEAAALASQVAAAASASSASASAVSASASAVSAAASAADAAASAADAAAAAVSAALSASSLPTITGTRAAPSAIVAGTGIAFTGTSGRNMWFVEGSGGVVDISANPQIAAATNIGQELRIVGRSDANTVKLDDSTGLSLNGSCILGEDQVIDLFWDGTSWVEISRSF